MAGQDRHDRLLNDGLMSLLEIKDSDIRVLVIEQGRTAVDRGIHIGGAFSAVIPLVTLYYGGFMDIDVSQPTCRDQDMFVLSKGHAVATMAAIYADLGYYDRSVLNNSRSMESILNGHPGPLLPGVHISTGPEGHGMPVAQGFAIAGRCDEKFDVFCLTGDGELQAGMIWEAAMYAGANRLDNLCVLVDKNEGQLDDPTKLHFAMPNVHGMFEAFGWRAFSVDGTQYGPTLAALNDFKWGKREGRPTAIICNTRKGYGGYSEETRKHKVELSESVAVQELRLQYERRATRVRRFLGFLKALNEQADGDSVRAQLLRQAVSMNLRVDMSESSVKPIQPTVKTRGCSVVLKQVRYDASALPKIDRSAIIAANAVVYQAMKVFAASGAVVSVDADLGTTSGLQGGVANIDVSKAINVGVAESNMLCVGEAFAVLGYNTWVSTFCPFFDWRVMRRIAIGFQERREVIESGGWLSEGHNLDLTFLATAANFETKTNGATHMANDDVLVLGEIAHLKVIDTSCPRQLLAIMKWIMEGSKGLVYLRVMRAPSAVLYAEDFAFEYRRGFWLRGDLDSEAFIVSSGRQVHESLASAELLHEDGHEVAVIDMPSLDEGLVRALHQSQRPVFVAEQNNGVIWAGCRKVLFDRCGSMNASRMTPINTLDQEGHPQFIHSATYGQLTDRFRLSPSKLARLVGGALTGSK